MNCSARLALLVSATLLAVVPGAVTAGPPLPSDVTLTMTVQSSAAFPLLPGTIGVLSLRVENRYPRTYGFTLSTHRTTVSVGAPPVRLFILPDAPEDSCHLQQVDDRPYIPGRYWFMRGGLAIGAAVTCRVGFEILPPGQAHGQLEFQAWAFGSGSAGYVDLTPGDNIAVLPFGQSPALAVPIARPAALAASVLALLLAGLLAVRRRAGA